MGHQKNHQKGVGEMSLIIGNILGLVPLLFLISGYPILAAISLCLLIGLIVFLIFGNGATE